MNYYSYYSEIEEAFNHRRGKFTPISPLDWALIETWEKREVPLHIILRGIEKVFDTHDAKPNMRRSIKGLSYCREEIEAQYEEWLERQVGKNSTEPEGEASAESSEFGDDSLREHLAQVAAEIDVAREKANGELKTVLERVSSRLPELEKTFSDAESLENALSDLEKLIDEALPTSLERKELDELSARITKNIASYKNKMEKEVYERTFDLMLLKALRERAGIPRLSLFYL